MRRDIIQLRKLITEITRLQVQMDPLAENKELQLAFTIAQKGLDLAEAISAEDRAEREQAKKLIDMAMGLL
jgi:hypothetical protein